MQFARILLGFSLAIGSCTFGFNSVVFAEENIALKQIEIPIIDSYGNGIDPIAMKKLISTDRQWKALWSLYNKAGKEALPKIDFKKSVVIVYQEGKSSSCRPLPGSKLQGTLNNMGDLSIQAIANTPVLENKDIPEEEVIITGDCNALGYRTTLYRIDRAGINTIQGRPLSDYLINPKINI